MFTTTSLFFFAAREEIILFITNQKPLTKTPSMRKLLILVLSVSIFLSCNNSKTSDKKGNTGDTTNDKSSDDNGKLDRNSGKYDDVVDDDEEGNKVPDDPNNWSSLDVQIFVKSCVNTAVDGGMARKTAEDYCNCMQKKLEARYPNSDDVGNFQQDSPEAKKMALDCLGMDDDSSPASNKTSSSSGWSRKEEMQFVDECVNAAVKQGMEELDAQSYCDCMQFKLEKIYPDYREANTLTSADMNSPSMKKMIKECLLN